MNSDHDHSHVTHSAKCDEAECTYVAETHAHDDNDAVEVLSADLAIHNKNVHGIVVDPESIYTPVREKMITLE